MNKAHIVAAGSISAAAIPQISAIIEWLGRLFPRLLIDTPTAAAVAGLIVIFLVGSTAAAVPGDKDGDGIPDPVEPNTATTISTTKTNETVPLPQPTGAAP